MTTALELHDKGHGFNYYKDKDGNVWYCLPQILKELGVNLNDNR